MPLAAPVTAIGPFSTTSKVLYTAPTAYQRDLVLTNGGTFRLDAAGTYTGRVLYTMAAP